MTQLSESMLESNPARPLIDADVLARCIDACVACAQACGSCADACSGEKDAAHLTRCIRLDLDCADLCTATARVLSRSQHPDHDVVRKLVEACAVVCQRCAEECEVHQDMHEHCLFCATACRTCLKACGEVLRHLAHAAVPLPSERPRHDHH